MTDDVCTRTGSYQPSLRYVFTLCTVLIATKINFDDIVDSTWVLTKPMRQSCVFVKARKLENL